MTSTSALSIEPAEEPVTSPEARLFRAHDAHPVALMMSLIKHFGTDWFEWEPETIKAEIVRSIGAKSISESNWNKIQAVKTLTNAVSFWDDWGVFEKIIQTLNNNIPRFDIVQVCTIPQLMAGIDIANSIRKEEFSDEIKQYVVACALEYGVTYLPGPLEFAADLLGSPRYRCLDCGNEDYDDLSDGRCDFCCGRFSDAHPLNGKPNPVVPDEIGRNIERYLLRDPSSVKARYDELVGKEDLGELSDTSPEDVQAVKLIVGHRYVLDRRQQMVDQLKVVEQ